MSRRTRTEELFTTRRKVFTCPHCGERISMMLDLSIACQRYIEDCEVCCNPIEISYQAEEGRIVSFQAGLP
ncbi:MAG TPA: CPXCG motif-containing cysteine-rich protein [Dongiaceae bacterium]|nr:CPXCG motif-containing cysteine-rich protein [Dongiaceae bacterium]